MTFPNRVHVAQPTTYTETGAGVGWVNPGNAVDGDESSYTHPSTMPPGSDSKELTMTGFDLSWFDSSALDMVGVTVIMKTQGLLPNVASVIQAQLVDDGGVPFGPDVASSYPYSTEYWRAFDIETPIPQAVYSSANFGFRIKLHNATSYNITINGIYACEIIPKFARKQLPPTSHGVKLFDAGGNDKLTLASSIVRLVAVHHVAGGFTGTISIPDFDDTKGVLFFVPEFAKYRSDIPAQQPASTDWASSNSLYLRGHGMEFPTADWNNTTKVLTVSTGGNYPLPAGFETRGDMTLGWAVVAVHYR